MDRFRLGIVGLGRHGERYARHLLQGEVEGAALAGVCRRDAAFGERFARANGVPYFSDARALAASPDIDGVIVVTPTKSHRAVALEVLAAGKPVLIEKPLAESEAAATEIAQAAARAGLACMVAHTMRREVVYRELARRIAAQPGPVGIDYVYVLDGRGDAVVRSLRAEGTMGRIFEVGVHILDWIAQLRPGAAGSLSCVADPPPPGEMRFTLRLRLPDLEAVISITEQPAPRFERIRVRAGDALWVGERFSHRLVRKTAGGEIEEPLPPVAPTLPIVAGEFVAGVRAGTRLEPLDGLVAVRLAEAATRSAATGGEWAKFS